MQRRLISFIQSFATIRVGIWSLVSLKVLYSIFNSIFSEDLNALVVETWKKLEL